MLSSEKKSLDNIEYTRYNNYIIFKNSYFHLKNNQDLYVLYPEKQWDLYKYTPSFSVFFGLFAVFPDWIGLNLWNLLNVLILLFAVYYLPKYNDFEKGLIILIVSIELLTSIQNSQSNGLMTGLFIFSFGFLERKKYFLSSLMIVCSVFIKLFGIVAFALFLLYPKKWKSALYSIICAVILLIIPFVFIDYNQYASLFQSYLAMLKSDHVSSQGYSVMGWLHSWFALDINKNIVVFIGAILFLVPLFYLKKFNKYEFRILTLASILIWVVIFNHKAESPTFIIAMTGVALWYVSSEKNNINKIMFIAAFIFTTLSATDIFPKFIRDEIVKPYTLKGFPCIVIWGKIIYDMLFLINRNRLNEEAMKNNKHYQESV
ncbi:MAG: DUF2029 domain-containing protein [Spirochaetia bacterium]|nr:DUF2029 domain-containing protein [Spirochaetia bacterium]